MQLIIAAVVLAVSAKVSCPAAFPEVREWTGIMVTPHQMVHNDQYQGLVYFKCCNSKTDHMAQLSCVCPDIYPVPTVFCGNNKIVSGRCRGEVTLQCCGGMGGSECFNYLQ